MDETLTFYTNPMSRGRIVRWMLEETGCDHDTVILDYESSLKAPEYLAINPMGKIPAIRHGDTIVTEAAAICAYLADAFPDAGLAPPPGNPKRGPYYRWMFFAAGPVEAVITGKALGLLAPPDKKRMAGYGSLEDTIDTMEKAVRDAAPFLCGEQFTAADVYVGASIGWGMEFGIIEKRPAFTDYVGMLKARPAYERAMDIDDGLIAQQQASAGTAT